MKRVCVHSIGAAMLLAAAIAFPIEAMTHGSSQNRKPSSDERKTLLTGRVVDESGQPIANVRVSATAVSQPLDRYRNTATGEDGRFSFDDLKPGSYKIDVYAGGYYLGGSDQPPTYYRADDSVTLKMIKGGVITGKITNSVGEPVIAVAVTAVRVPGLEGRASVRTRYPNQRMTDDRGVYRLYGLPPGVFVVMAGGGGALPAYQDDAPTYHPSANRDEAAEVTVQAGQEVSGIDIRYRGERGHTVSGSVSAPEPKGGYAEVVVYLFDSRTGLLAAESYSDPRPGRRSFAFHGVPDGDYLIRAHRGAYLENRGASSPGTAVKVKGSDVTGLALTLRAMGSIAGRVQLQPLTDGDRKAKCESKLSLPIHDSLVFARSEDKENKNAALPLLEEMVAAPGEKGDFKISNVEAGRYRIEARLPDEEWYVRSMTLPTAAGKPPIDAARDGIALSPEQQVNGLTITLAEGAAKLRGRVAPETQGEALPGGLHVFLVPAEKESANDALRFFEVSAGTDDAFELTNIQPGRYWMLALAYSDDKESANAQRRPRAWDTALRSKLRSAGETTNNAIEFRACQRVVGHVLRFSPLTLGLTPKHPDQGRVAATYR